MKKILVCFLVLAILLLTGCDDSIYRTGDVDYYYEHGIYLSPWETSWHCVYSEEFVKKFELLDFSFHYYTDETQLLHPFGTYDASLVSMTYVDLFQDEDEENVALTSGYETIEELAEELFSNIYYWCSNELHYLVYDNAEEYKKLLKYWKGEEWKY